MSDRPQHLDFLFNQWPYEFGEVAARRVRGADGREVVQLRVEMGVLQMEIEGRPDGTRPGGYPTCADWLSSRAQSEGEEFVLDDRRCVEIDREFVRGLPLDAENAAITSSIVGLAHSLAFEVVAEGVETEAEEEFLQSLRCDVVQGFLHARPMTSADLESWHDTTFSSEDPRGGRIAGVGARQAPP